MRTARSFMRGATSGHRSGAFFAFLLAAAPLAFAGCREDAKAPAKTPPQPTFAMPTGQGPPPPLAAYMRAPDQGEPTLVADGISAAGTWRRYHVSS